MIMYVYLFVTFFDCVNGAKVEFYVDKILPKK